MAFVFTARRLLPDAGGRDGINLKASLEGYQDTTGKVNIKLRTPGWPAMISPEVTFIGEGDLVYSDPPTMTIYKIIPLGHFDQVSESELYDVLVNKGIFAYPGAPLLVPDFN